MKKGNLAEEMHCAAFAFLCPVNRNETLKEHGYSDWDYADKENILFSNPQWLLDHYFKYSELGAKISIEEQEKIAVFLRTHPNGRQISLSFLCPVNRHSVRVEYGYTDKDLLDHYQTLILHYASSGGAKKNAEEREKEKCTCKKEPPKRLRDIIRERFLDFLNKQLCK